MQPICSYYHAAGATPVLPFCFAFTRRHFKWPYLIHTINKTQQLSGNTNSRTVACAIAGRGFVVCLPDRHLRMFLFPSFLHFNSRKFEKPDRILITGVISMLAIVAVYYSPL